MKSTSSFLVFASSVSLTAIAAGQQPEDAPATIPVAPLGATFAEKSPSPELDVRALAPAALSAGDLFTVPIRSAEGDLGHAYGTWASGPDYKVSFHEGFAFYPVLGGAYERNLPLAWRTLSVTCGDVSLLGADEQAEHRVADWRYEYRYAQFTEAYDVRGDGVEQTFVFGAPFASGGDLVVRGLVTTELRAAMRASEHGALEFLGERGERIVSYGAAQAVDARGARVPVPAAWDGQQLTLTVPAAWIADAVFPLTLDPLIGSTVVSFDSGGRQASRPDVARDDGSNQLMVVYGRLNAGGDYDLYARLTDSSFGATTIVYNDITASWSTRNGDVAFVGGADRWVIALQRDFPSTTGSWIRAHVHDSGDTTLSTTWISVAGSTGNSLTVPDVGGTAATSTGTNALIVYQSDTGLVNSSTSQVFGVLLDAAASTHGTPFSLEVGATFDRETPSVNQESDGGTASWITCWTQLDNSIAEDDWDMIIRRIDASGVSQGRSFLGNVSAIDHAFQPRVAGRNGRYMASFGEDPNPAGVQVNGWGNEIWAQRFDWSETSSSAVIGARERVRISRAVEYWNGNIAYDSTSDSHWGLTYHSDTWNVYAERVGYDANVCESVVVYDTASQGFSPGITFDDDANRFPLVFTATEAGTQPQPVFGVQFTYPTFNQPSLYGTGCGPAVLGSNSTAHSRKPHSGQEFFEVRVSSAPNNAAGLLVIGVNPIDLALPGFPGCHLHVGMPLVYLPLNATGATAAFPAPIPSGLSGDVYLEWFYVNPAAPGGLQITRGLKVEVR
jgi:hypothetical protein